MNRGRLKGHLNLPPMTVPTAGPAHGYAIVDLHEGTIYPALQRRESTRGAAQVADTRRMLLVET